MCCSYLQKEKCFGAEPQPAQCQSKDIIIVIIKKVNSSLKCMCSQDFNQIFISGALGVLSSSEMSRVCGFMN